MAIKKSSQIASKASKAKNRKWSAVQRFSSGHDQASRFLMPESELLQFKNVSIKTGVYRASSFGMSREERVYHDAKHLLKYNLADNIDDAVEKAISALESKRSAEQ